MKSLDEMSREELRAELARVMSENERETARLAAVVQSGFALTETLETSHLRINIARLAIPYLADWCVLWLVDDEVLRAVSVSHASPSRDEELIDALRSCTAPLDAAEPAAEAWRSNSPVLVEHLSTGTEARHGGRSLLALPLRGARRRLGVISLVYGESGRRYSRGDVLYGEEIAVRVALALDNSHRYQEALGAVRARDELLAVVTHELRSPLSSLHLTAHALARGGGEDKHRASKQVSNMLSVTERMRRLVDDLLDAATAEAGALRLTRRSADVARLVDEVVAVLAPEADAQHVCIDVEVEPELPRAWCDAHRVAQVLTNLVGNAIKFVHAGGRVRVTARAADESVCVSVLDDGPGIPPDELPRVFERHFRGSLVGAHGAGLGLHIAKLIVEAHGGQIWVESGEGRGSTFFFTLPCSAPEERARVRA